MEVLTAEKLIEEGKLLKELMLPLLTKEDIQRSPIAHQIRLEGELLGMQKGELLGMQKGELLGMQKGQLEGERIGWQKGQLEGERIGWQKGQLEGERVGWQKGQQKALSKTLSRILVIQFQVELSHFAAKLPQLSIEALEALCEVALTVPTMAEFEQALADYLPPPDSPSQS